MKYLFFTIAIIISLVYSQTTVTTYCTNIVTTCTGNNNQYADAAACETIANGVNISGGADTDTGGDTLGCRVYHLGVAGGDPDTHCVHAGPTGGDACGNYADDFCAQMNYTCFGNYSSAADCVKLVNYKDSNNVWLIPRDGVNHFNTSGNSLQCRFYHLYAGLTLADTGTHCPHAGFSGAGVCGDAISNYCHFLSVACPTFYDAALCSLQAERFPLGVVGDTSGNSLHCRIYHIGAGVYLNDLTTHCPHGSFSGGNVCGTYCEAYCDTIQSVCT
jgi:hypothetical protein